MAGFVPAADPQIAPDVPNLWFLHGHASTWHVAPWGRCALEVGDDLHAVWIETGHSGEPAVCPTAEDLGVVASAPGDGASILPAPVVSGVPTSGVRPGADGGRTSIVGGGPGDPWRPTVEVPYFMPQAPDVDVAPVPVPGSAVLLALALLGFLALRRRA